MSAMFGSVCDLCVQCMYSTVYVVCSINLHSTSNTRYPKPNAERPRARRPVAPSRMLFVRGSRIVS